MSTPPLLHGAEGRARQTLWALALLLGCAFALRPIDDTDIFTQVTLGNTILREGLMFLEPLSFTVAERLGGVAVPNPGWLWQLIFSWVAAPSDWILLAVIHIALLVTAFVIMASSEERNVHGEGLSPGPLLDVVVLWFLAIANNSSVRPQIVALTCFVVLYRPLVHGRVTLRMLGAVGLVLLFWQNVHLSVVVTLPLIVARVIRTASEGGGGPVRLTALREALFLVVLVVGAMLATPLGSGVFALSRDNFEISNEILRNLEWLPAWAYGFDAMLPFWGVLALTTWLVLRDPKGIPLWRWVVIVAYTGLALSAARFVLLWATAMIPTWIYLIDRARTRHHLSFLGDRVFRTRPAFRSGLYLALISFCAIGIARRPLFTGEIPFGCLEKVAERHRGERVFVQREWAGPLEYISKGEVSVQADGRLYLYSPSFWRRYQAILQGKVPIAELRNEFPVTAFVLDAESAGGLVAMLRSQGAGVEDDKGGCVVVTPPSFTVKNITPNH